VTLPPFQALVDQHGADVHRFLVGCVGPVDAADCLQETFLSALRAYPDLRDASNLRGWLFTIAHRKTLDLHRSRSRAAVPVGAVPEGGAGASRIAEPADEGLWERVRSLPPKQRTAIVHRFVGDLPYSEIAAVLGCSEAAARQNVQHGLRALRKEWSDE
jgi:RNA polymerase sigma factor (sigma-70 family)